MSLDRIDVALTLVTGIAGWIGYLWKIRPKIRRIRRRLTAFFDVFVGRGEVVDEVSGRKLPEIPPLHERLLTQDLQLVRQDNRLDRMEKTLDRLTDVYSRLDQHEARIGVLEAGLLERAATKLEGAAALQAIEKLAGDVIDGEVTDERDDG